MKLSILTNDLGLHGAATSALAIQNCLTLRGHAVEIVHPGAESRGEIVLLYNLVPRHKLEAVELWRDRRLWDLSCGDAQYATWTQAGLLEQAIEYGKKLEIMIVKDVCEVPRCQAFFCRYPHVIPHGITSRPLKRGWISRLRFGWASRPDERLERELREAVAPFGEFVRAVGLPRQEMSGWYQGIDILIMPRVHLCGSNAILEAMAHGIPVLAARGKGNSSQVLHGVTGWTYDPGDLPLLLDRIARAPRSLLESMGAEARLRAQNLYSSDAMALSFERLLDRNCAF